MSRELILEVQGGSYAGTLSERTVGCVHLPLGTTKIWRFCLAQLKTHNFNADTGEATETVLRIAADLAILDSILKSVYRRVQPYSGVRSPILSRRCQMRCNVSGGSRHSATSAGYDQECAIISR